MTRATAPEDRCISWQMKFRPNVELVSVVRRFVGEFYAGVLDDRDAISRVAMATHELLENAVKYSTDGETSVAIDIVAHEGGSRITIRVDNRADVEHLAMIRAAFDAMEEAPDAHAYYQFVMRKSVTRTDGSGLGLARVFAEGEMTMTVELGEDQRVSIVAQTEVSAKIGA